MTANQNAAQNSAATNRPRDLILRLYREIGIQAVAAALEASARRPQGIQRRNDLVFPSVPAAHERIGHLCSLAHVSTVEDPGRVVRPRSVDGLAPPQ